MADSLSVTATLGTSPISSVSVPVTTAQFYLKFPLDDTTSDQTVSLAGMTAPKYLIVKGATGISFKLGSTGVDSIGANPVAVVSLIAGMTPTSIKISNSDTIAHTVEILAGE